MFVRFPTHMHLRASLQLCLVLASGWMLACRDVDSKSPAPSSAPTKTSPSSTPIPFVKQQAASDCGAAAIAMTLGVYGQPTDLGAVKREMKDIKLDPDVNGLSGLDLVKFAEKHGLGAAGLKLADTEVKSLAAGDILWFGFNHFVVFDRVEGQTFHIVDPAEGPRALDQATLASVFSGVAVIFAASPEAMQRRKTELGL